MNKRPFFLLLVLWLALRAAASAYYDPHTQTFLSRDPIREHGGINLYAYCGNDPVGNYDPIGLMTAEEYKAFVEAARARNGTTGEFFASFWYLPGLFNPFDHGSPLSLTRRGLHEGTGLAVQGIDSSPVPWPMKAVAKFGLGVGIAGDSLNPLNSGADLSETAIQIKDRGIVDVATTTVQGMGRTIVEQPVMASGIFMVGAASFNGARLAVPNTSIAGTPASFFARTRLEIEALRQQGLSRSEAFSQLRSFNAGNADGYLFHFTNLRNGQSILFDRAIRATQNGLGGTGVYVGTTPIPNFFQRFASPIGWGLNPSYNVRIPLMMTPELEEITTTPLLPRWTRILGSGEDIPIGQ